MRCRPLSTAWRRERPAPPCAGGFDGLPAVPVSSRHAERDARSIPDGLASARPPRVRLAEALRPGSGPGTRPIALSPRPPFGLRLRQEVLLLRQAGPSPEAHLAPAAAPAPAPAPAWRPRAPRRGRAWT